MKTFKEKILLCAASVCMSLMSTTSAHAIYYDYTDSLNNKMQVQQSISKTESSINSTIDSMQNNVVEALKKSTGQTSGNLKEGMAADAALADAQDSQEVKRRIEDAKYNAARESMPTLSNCIATTSAITGSGLSGNSGGVRTAVSQSLVDYQMNRSNLTPTQMSDLQTTAHCTKFSTQADVDSGLCSSVTGTQELANADVDASRSVFAGETLKADNEEASNLLITRIVGSDPWAVVSKDEALTPQGKANIVKRDQIVAKRSVATEALSYIRASKTSSDNPQLAAWATARAAATGVQRADPDGGVSLDEQMDLQARSWYFDQDWVKGLQDKNLDAKVVDLANIGAFQVYQNQQSYKLLQRMTALLATNLAIAVDQEKARVTASNQ